MTGRPTRIVLVDDHVLVRSGLKALLDAEPDLEVTGEADNGADGAEVALERRPDVVLMDVEMPVLDGIEATKRLMAAGSRARVLALIAPAGLEQLLSVVADPTTDPDDRAALLAVGGVQTVPSA
jgi:DNA-binding NarL/FixJ family response regulator